MNLYFYQVNNGYPMIVLPLQLHPALYSAGFQIHILNLHENLVSNTTSVTTRWRHSSPYFTSALPSRVHTQSVSYTVQQHAAGRRTDALKAESYNENSVSEYIKRFAEKLKKLHFTEVDRHSVNCMVSLVRIYSRAHAALFSLWWKYVECKCAYGDFISQTYLPTWIRWHCKLIFLNSFWSRCGGSWGLCNANICYVKWICW